MYRVIPQVNNERTKVHAPCVGLTSSTEETVFLQSLILDWKVDVRGEFKSSFVRTTKSDMLICSGMFCSQR